MKKYLSGIVAVILAISFSAFTITPKTVSGKLTDYRWAKTNLDGTIPANPQIYNGPAAGVPSQFSCPAGATYFCAKAVDVNNVPLTGGPVVKRGM